MCQHSLNKAVNINNKNNWSMQAPNLQPVFKLELNHKVTPGIVTIAKYDGTHACLTASAGYDKVISYM